LNWLKRKVLKWIEVDLASREAYERKLNSTAVVASRDAQYHDNPLNNCEQLRFTIINVDNGTLVRMDSHRPQDEYTVRAGPPRTPPTFIVKDDEKVQDVIVRLLGIAALEKS
jgi:hypothetical protein